MNKNKKASKQKRSKSKQKITPKIQIKPKPFQLLKQLKESLLKLPSGNEFEALSEGSYLRQLTDVYALLSNSSELATSSESIFYLIDVERSMKQFLNMFCNLTSHKEIVIGIFGEIYKRVFDRGMANDGQSEITNFLQFLQRQLFSAIQFLIIFETGVDSQEEASNNVNSKLLPKEYSLFQQKIIKRCFSLLDKFTWASSVLEGQIELIQTKIKQNQKLFDTKTQTSNSSLLLTFLALNRFSHTVINNAKVFTKIIQK